MTKLIKRKGLLFLMAIAVMVAMMSVACKNKSTGVSLSVEEPAVANVSEELTPDAELSIDKNAHPGQYAGKYFESRTYVNNDGIAFKYTIEIKNHNDGRSIVLIFTDDKNGGKQYNFPGFHNGRGDNYYNYNEGGSGVLNDGINAANTLKVKFYNDENGGWADVKPSNCNFTIKLALKNK